MTLCEATTRFIPLPDDRLASLLEELADALPRRDELLALCNGLKLEEDFPRAPHCYSRNILFRAPDGTEVMAARWDSGARTPIHGHPQLAFVYLLEGRLLIENFARSQNGLVAGETRTLEPGDHLWSRGKSGRFDNAIHRVTALQPSLSLHVYSDDALKGEVY